MSTYKTNVSSEILDTFIAEHSQYGDIDLQTIANGELSQAYLFEAPTGPKVLRINKHSDEGFQKDKLAHDRFSSDLIPIPRIEEIGQFSDGSYYAVSERSRGKTLDSSAQEEIEAVKQSIIQTMEAIHATQPIGGGYGFIKLDGNGKYSSWHEAMDGDQYKEEEPEKLAACPFFQPDIYARLRAKIKEYYKFCPNDTRQLVHRDYGFGNTLAEGDRITGVIDWHDAQYGDPMYDVAWLDFWGEFQQWPHVAEDIKQHYIKQGRLPDNFDERLACYKLIIGANSMSFFAKSEQEDKYRWARDEVIKIMDKLSEVMD
jgi:hygromycin-B 4-O-kinase